MNATATDDPISVLVVDDHPYLREGVRAMIEAAGMVVADEAASGEAALEAYRSIRPDVVLIDLQMPGMGGVAAIGALTAAWPDARIVVLTTYTGDARALRALRAGASGYLLKNSLRQDLIDTIRSVHAGGKRLDSSVATAIAFQKISDDLSEREIEVLGLVAHGHSNRRIGERLGLSEDTVKGHMKAVLSKLSASDRTHAVTIAARRGLIDL